MTERMVWEPTRYRPESVRADARRALPCESLSPGHRLSRCGRWPHSLIPHQIVGVLTQPDRPAGRGRKLTPSVVKEFSIKRGYEVSQPSSLRTEAGRESLHRWQPDILVVVAYGLILPPEALSIPKYGCINIHASLLPRWRGAAPIQRAILEGIPKLA